MKKEDLWARYVAKNPQFGKPGQRVTLTTEGLKKLFEQTYDIAHARGLANGNALASMERGRAASQDPFDLFKEVFGNDSPI